MPKTVLVRPNVEWFRKYVESKGDFARKLNISPSSLRNILKGLPVSKPTLERIAEATGVPFHELVSLNQPRLERNPIFYQSLCHGWFVENDRNHFGTPTWFHEIIHLVPSKSVGKRVCLTGTIKNNLHGKFEVRAELVGKCLFSIICTSTDGERCFVAGLTTHVKKSGVNALCGTWTGYNHVGTPAVCRLVMTDTDEGVSPTFLTELCSEVNVSVVLGANEFTF